MTSQSMRGHACCDKPLEEHEFHGADYLCTACQRPRALHRERESATIPSNLDPLTYPLRSSNFAIAMRGKMLTDKRIEEYQQRGFYSEQFREARRAYWARQASNNRQGNFVQREGRLIYSPL